MPNLILERGITLNPEAEEGKEGGRRPKDK